MEHASPEEYDDHASDGDSSHDDQDIKLEATNGSPSSLGGDGKAVPAAKKPAGHLQKRRRVTRACDECRRKKIKCDGTQPCTHCTVYSYDCTYDQPSNRRRNPAPQYVENLEHRVHRAETLLHILIPNLNLDHPGIDAAVAQGWIPGAPGKGQPSPAAAVAAVAASAASASSTGGIPEAAAGPQGDTNLESMVRAVAQLELDEMGHWDYHGHSSGLSFIRRMREQLGEMMGPDTVATPFVKSRPMSQVLESPRSAGGSPMSGESPNGLMDLPPKDIAVQLCQNAVHEAAALLRVVHHPSFWASFERIYNTPMDNFRDEDHVFLPLFYSAMALGSLFGKDDPNNTGTDVYESAIQQGFHYFKTARQMMDITDCRDLSAIQAVVFMILFLQSSAKLSQCYAYVGVALRASLRLGLHRAAPGRFTPVEAEIRKRVFWIVRKMDIYVGALLGLPQTLNDDDIDQEFPLEVDDEYMTKNEIRRMPEGKVSLMAAFNAHTRLVNILSKIVRNVYPIKIKAPLPGSAEKSYSVPFSIIRELEGDLERWKSDLPAILNPCEAPVRYMRVQLLLRLSYAHAQVMLYRPFLHFTAMEKRSQPVDQRAYTCAASFVNVSRNIIHLTTQMKQKGLLDGSFWFIMYTTFFSILGLVYFAVENPDNATTEAVIKDAIEGKEVLASLAFRSMAADRCTATLTSIFDHLPARVRTGQHTVAPQKKRGFTSLLSSDQPNPRHQLSRSHTDTGNAAADALTNGRRANTSTETPSMTSASNLLSFDSPWSANSYTAPLTPTNAFDTNGFSSLSQPPTSHTPLSNASSASFIVPQNMANPALTDLSSMMFPPSDEPFGYPNQPLTTFENNQQFSKDGMYLDGGLGGIGGPRNFADSKSAFPDGNMEAQFYAFPPNFEQRPPQRPVPLRQRTSMNPSSQSLLYPDGQTAPMNAWPAQAAFLDGQANINLNDLFGGAEWNPNTMMHPMYSQQPGP